MDNKEAILVQKTHCFLYIPGVSLKEPRRSDLGGKAFSCYVAKQLGLPVPEFVVINRDGWEQWREENLPQVVKSRLDITPHIPDELWKETQEGICHLEQTTGKKLGDTQKPLFFSARSGAEHSLPGAMITILNIGITDETLPALEAEIGSRAALYNYFTLIRDLGVHAGKIKESEFLTIRDEYVGHHPIVPPDEQQYRLLIQAAKDLYERETKTAFPIDPTEQLQLAMDAVYRSWESPDAISVRKLHHVSDREGTAIQLIEMKWGNSELPDAGAGVVFSRNPEDLGPETCVFAPHGQGTKVVSDSAKQKETSMDQIPERFREEMKRIVTVLDEHFGFPVEIEFTIDGNNLWILQARKVPLSSLAEFRYMIESIQRGVITEDDAKKLITLAKLHRILAPGLDPVEMDEARKKNFLGKGLSQSPGNTSAQVVFNLDEARNADYPVIYAGPLTRQDVESLPKNIVGIVTPRGSIGSHIARLLTGYDDRGLIVIYGLPLHNDINHTYITLSGDTGEVFKGRIRTTKESTNLKPAEKARALEWEKERRRNLWKFVIRDNGIKLRVDEAKQRLQEAAQKFIAEKARVISVVNDIFPAKIRMEYTVLPINTDVQIISDLGNKILRSDHDVTIRSCPHPDIKGRGRSPYRYLQSKVQLKEFLNHQPSTAKSSINRWRRQINPRLTEIAVGSVPKGKLQPWLHRFHCAWTLGITHDSVVLQVATGTPYLRSHEETDDKKPSIIMSAIVRFDPTAPNGIRLQEIVFGDGIIQRRRSKNRRDKREYMRSMRMFSYVVETVFGQWWKEYNIPALMAALSEAFPYETYYPLALEGQARIGKKPWCMVYGVKADPRKRRPFDWVKDLAAKRP